MRSLFLLSFANVLILLPLATAITGSAEDQILAIMPGSASCDASNSECRTASQAADPLIKSFMDYKVYSPGAIAAVLSVIGCESGDLKYNTKQDPGQGTRNMQMYNFNLMYAKSIPELAEQAAALETQGGTNPSADIMNQVRELVLPDEYSFASGAWFLTSQCPSAVRQFSDGQVNDGWTTLCSCIGVDCTQSDRAAYWSRAKTVFGL